MYPAHTQLVAKWSSPSIGDQRATGCDIFLSLLTQAIQLALLSSRICVSILPATSLLLAASLA